MKPSKNYIWKAPRPYLDNTYRGYEFIVPKHYQTYDALSVFDALHRALELLAAIHKYSLVYDNGRFFCDGWEIFLLRNGGYSNIIVTRSTAPKGYCWPLAYGVPMTDDLLFFAYSDLCGYENIDVSLPRASAEGKGA